MEQAEERRHCQHADDAAAGPDAGNPGKRDQARGGQTDAVDAKHHGTKDTDRPDQAGALAGVEFLALCGRRSNHFSHSYSPFDNR